MPARSLAARRRLRSRLNGGSWCGDWRLRLPPGRSWAMRSAGRRRSGLDRSGCSDPPAVDADAMSLRDRVRLSPDARRQDRRPGRRWPGSVRRPEGGDGSETGRSAGTLQEIVPPGGCDAARVPVQGRVHADARRRSRAGQGTCGRPGSTSVPMRWRSAEGPAGKGPSCTSGILRRCSRNPCEIPSHTLGGSR